MPADVVPLVDRLTWGVAPTDVAEAERLGADSWLEQQLASPPAQAAPAAQAQIDAMRISRQPMAEMVMQLDDQRRAIYAMPDSDEKKTTRDAYGKSVNDVLRESQTRSLLRDLYAPDQLREQMTWFWFNHFSIQSTARDIRVMVGDYEDQIRTDALGRFRDLLEATLRHPAMLRFLDNDQNAVGHINENYAREIMELHTLGVGSGYTQQDVQELARILTGVGVSLRPPAQPPRLKPEWQPLYQRAGLFEFNPARHDFGDKTFLGHTIHGSGYAEVEQALDLIAAAPATAHHVSRQLAVYFVGDKPPPALVDRMASTFQRSGGDIPEVLRTLFRSPEFKASLGLAFKDPTHYTISAVRLAYGDRVILNAEPVIGWLQRMGEGLWGRSTPDGYPLESQSWTGPGQMELRFEIARQIGGGPGRLFKTGDDSAPDRPVSPQVQNELYTRLLRQRLSPATLGALDQARTPQEWNALYLSSPEFMRR